MTSRRAHAELVPVTHAPAWLVSYDVSRDDARRRIARTLAEHGVRRLYSAFHLPSLEDDDLGALLDRLDAQLGPHDLLVAHHLCPNCVTLVAGHGIEPIDPVAEIV